jgi:hypothetical protein
MKQVMSSPSGLSALVLKHLPSLPQKIPIIFPIFCQSEGKWIQLTNTINFVDASDRGFVLVDMPEKLISKANNMSKSHVLRPLPFRLDGYLQQQQKPVKFLESYYRIYFVLHQEIYRFLGSQKVSILRHAIPPRKA